jgi:hypothetical protein
MTTLYVKKDGSGNSTTIQGAIPLAVSGDIIMVEAGTFEENLDFYKDGLTIQGAGKDQTFIVGQQQANFVKAGCSWATASTTINVPAGTTGLKAGHIVSASGIAANTRIVSVGATSFTISANTTAAKTNVSVTMGFIDSAIRWRGNGNTLKNVKLSAIQALETRAASDNGAIYFRTSGLGAVAAQNYLIENCEIEARGEFAIVADNTGPGGGTVTGCVINGKTFVGEQPAQVHAFSSLALSCNILSSTTIELPSSEYLVDVKVGSPILTVAGFTQSGTTVSAISGNVLTLNKALLSGVGSTQTVTLTNIQFNIPNVARQLVVFQPNNTSPVTFTNNIINGVTGGGISYNQAVTCDVIGSTLTGNTFNGEFGAASYALRVRGLNSTVSNNENLTTAYPNLGYYVLPNWALSQVITVGTMISNSGLYFNCIQEHTSSATNAPTGVDGALYWELKTLEEVNASGVYGVGLLSIGSNSSVSLSLLSFSQTSSGDPIVVSFDKEVLKSIVASDPEFSLESNWYLVGLVYKKDSKRMTSGFKADFTQSKEMKLKSGLPGETFSFHKVIISKQDRTLKTVSRSEVSNPSAMDIVLK